MCMDFIFVPYGGYKSRSAQRLKQEDFNVSSINETIVGSRGSLRSPDSSLESENVADLFSPNVTEFILSICRKL